MWCSVYTPSSVNKGKGLEQAVGVAIFTLRFSHTYTKMDTTRVD